MGVLMKNKTLMGSLIIILISIIIMGCGLGSYSTTRYLDILNDNPQERLLSIGSFRGTKFEKWEFDSATEILVQSIVEKGNLTIALYNSDGDFVFDREVKAGEDLRESFYGDFETGEYTLAISARRARGITIAIEFMD